MECWGRVGSGYVRSSVETLLPLGGEDRIGVKTGTIFKDSVLTDI